jgi:hypothetical protein
MASRLDLHAELVKFLPNVYFQPPSTIQMSYPCIVYNKTIYNNTIGRQYANNGMYSKKQCYQIMLIEKNPDSTVADSIEQYFEYCEINQYYTVDNLYHTTLILYY